VTPRLKSFGYFNAAGFAGAGAFERLWSFEQGVAEFSAGFCGFGFEMFDNVGMLGGGVGGFADVVDEIVEFGFFEFAIFVGNGFAVVTAGFTVEGAVGMRELKFPMAIATDDGLELVDFVIEPIRFVRIF